MTPQAALDYGQFALRQLPPEINLEALKGKRIVIDPGHGGIFGGAVGSNNLREADVNLGVALYLWGMLTNAGAEAHLTRMADANVYQGADIDLKKDLQARVDFARLHKADLFVSVHHNADAISNRKKNSLETYFKLSDPGPSLDLAKCIHRQLALSLKQPDSAILPGNFHVLRESPATAVLGEPSYISDADNAFKLGLSPMQRVEAQAYFFGIAEYFSRGVPRIEDMEPRGLIRDDPRPLFTARVIDDRGAPIDSQTAAMFIDGKPAQPNYNKATSVVSYLPPRRLSNGKHTVRLSIRNVNGNSAREEKREIEISMPPAHIFVEPNFEAVRAGTAKPVRLSVTVFDADLTPVADGTVVDFKAVGGRVSPSTAVTRSGEAIAFVTPLGGPAASGAATNGEASNNKAVREIPVTVSSSGVTQTVRLAVTKGAPDIFVATVRDAKTNLPVDLALVEIGGRPAGYTDRTGYFAIVNDKVEGLGVRFSRAGYEAREISFVEPDGVEYVKLEPVAGGIFFGQKFVIDPQFGGQEKGSVGPGGLRASDLNLLVASYLARLLRAAGADIVLTRESDETLSALRRVELAEKAGAQWFISIGHGSQNAGPALVTDQLYIDQPAEDVCVMHYASSERGGRLADAIATALKEEGVAESVYVGTSSAMVVTHTSGVAVIVLGPDPSACETEGTLRHPEAARKEADAIYRGILASFSSTERESENVTTMEEDR
ncbi:MAG: N-acetylmuramoyl-L-alanine amidase [Candidatus Lindowbacteria bacterium]|nr:N-acetylmuramoyl-L-alanine amidase [Candidatus Lindowbacteria bacterium]